ncbi:phosphate ABC transporter substrate-binding protein PstS family protein [Weissella diestrammenae]|uniref:Phosphate-binding protein n=1 Tax=Weissella diestrammenae TaxID=1162633 RepID=A0A7G9T3Y5_9LACO|nr:phosphate ABC transporter substrate-binding protein PstS family protein [Weissella diestrammenae]MCM0583006.1 phosphate ABC transporter substrate-binding protein PstS family protein [Weissella diestrammenae]QNN74810.1 phosphate ABC transporter substrate-binding protein PstS family protein [Weissella diestrammenae]
MKQKWLWGTVAVAAVAAITYAYLNHDGQKSVNINAVGSTALQPMIEAAGEEYQRETPGVFVNVQGGGSGTGLAQVQSGAVDLGNADMFAEEKAGIKAKQLVDHWVAVVGISPIVNKQAGIKNLTSQQLNAIFTKQVTNWQQVGGKNLPIVLVNRVAGSGTRATFERYGLNGSTSADGQEQDSSGTARSIVASTPGAISYVAFSYLDDDVVTVPTLNDVKPLNANVISGAYPIWSYEHVYTKGKPSADVQKFLDYLQSNKIQKTVVPRLGYISIHDMQVQRNVAGQISKVK